MAATSSTSLALLKHTQLLLLLLLLLLLSRAHSDNGHCYTAIFAFGDSMTETGNYVISLSEGEFTHVRYPPYGETFFHRPTGRYCDGRIIVDFLAEAFGLPYLRPYLAGPGVEGGFRHGANFAFAGATALDGSFFLERRMGHVFTNNSLRVQVDWFRHLLPTLCSSTTECKRLLGGSLFVVGEIGGNDYNHPLSDGVVTFDEIQSFTPAVIHAILAAVEELIELGARTLVVPGTYPIGCMPSHLTEFQTKMGGDDYDELTGCIRPFNKLSHYHNAYLRRRLDQLRRRNPHTTIIFADYYESTMAILRDPQQYGFDRRSSRMACCGSGGTYNYDPSLDCGCPRSVACADPSKSVYWDGYHLTEAAYRTLATNLLQGDYAFPPLLLLHACSNALSNTKTTSYSSQFTAYSTE